MKMAKNEFLKYLLDNYVKSATWEEFEKIQTSSDPWEIFDFWNRMFYIDFPSKNQDGQFELESITIPEDFGEGKCLEMFDGKIIKSVCGDHLNGRKGRRIAIELMQFPGNPHTYCKLNAGYLTWTDGKSSYGGYIKLKDGTAAPALPELQWSIKRLVPKDEILNNPVQWDRSYREDVESGDEVTSERFLSRLEAVATALFVGISRCEGPLELFIGHWSLYEPDIFCTVHEDGTVEFQGFDQN